MSVQEKAGWAQQGELCSRGEVIGVGTNLRTLSAVYVGRKGGQMLVGELVCQHKVSPN